MAFPVLLNSVFDPDAVSHLTSFIRFAIPPDLPYEAINSYNMANTIAHRGPDAHKRVEQVFRLFCESRCLDVARALLKDDIAILVTHSAFRYHEPGDRHSHLPYHLDGGFMGRDATTLNFWIPMVDVGVTAPGLTFLRPELDPNLYLRSWLVSSMNRQDLKFSSDDLSRIYGQPAEKILVSPVLAAGSVAVFHHLTLHATQQLPNGGDYRVSMEMRIAAQSAVPKVYQEQGLQVAIPIRSGNDWRFEYRDMGLTA